MSCLVRRATALLGLCGARMLAAQEAAPPDSSPPGGTFVPLPVVFYQPETGTGFGGLATYYFRPSAPTGRSVPPSELTGLAIYTTKKQILTSLGTRLYLSGGALRVVGSLVFTKFPTKFWGIGNETPEDVEEDYTPLTLAALAEVQRRVIPGWFVGARVQVARRELREVSDSGQLVTGTVPGSEDGRILEGALLVTHDVRNHTLYPTHGRYAEFALLGASEELGSDFGYWGSRVDIRAYLSPGGRHVLALRALGDARNGTPPFDMLPQLGGDVLLRGYYTGRFRDQLMVALQTEYRFPVIWRIGMVAFAEVGQVAPRASDLHWQGFKASLGGGLRFLLSPEEGLSLRADYGYGFDVRTGGFYPRSRLSTVPREAGDKSSVRRRTYSTSWRSRSLIVGAITTSSTRPDRR